MDPTTLGGPAAVLGGAAGVASRRPGRGEAAWAPPLAVALLAGLGFWLPRLAAGGPLVVAAATGGATWALAERIDPRRLPPLGAAAAATAAGLLLAMHLAMPDGGLAAVALLGTLLCLPAALLELPAAASPAASTPPPGDRGLLLGVAVGGAAPLLAIAGGPVFGPSPSWFAEVGTALAAGIAAAALLTATAPRVARAIALISPVALLAAAGLMLQGHDAVGWLLAKGVAPAKGGAPLAATLVTVAAFAAVGLAAGRPGPRTAAGVAAGAALWIVLPEAFGIDLALRAMVAGAALAVLAVVVADETRLVRTAAAAAAAAGLGGLALPAPPGGIRAVAPYEAMTDAGSLAQLDLAAGWRTGAARDSARGTVAVLADLRPPVRWHRGEAVEVGRRARSADAFFAHLPGLLTGDPPASMLVLGAGHGAVADSARRATAGAVVVVAPSPAERWLIRSHGSWNRNVAADPAVRLVRRAPRGDRYGAVLVDLPPPWVPGAPAAWSPGRLRSLAERVPEGGVVVVRVPLETVSGDELGAIAADVTERFEAVTAWLDPTGSSHLLLAARHTPGTVDAGAVWRAWSRRTVRDELQAASLASPADVLERLITDRDGLRAMAEGRSRRGRFGTAVAAGARVRGGRRALPLATLAAAGGDAARLFDLGTVPETERDAVRERLAAASRARGDYLAMLEALATGDSLGALETARRIAEGGTNPTKDLRALIDPWLRRCRALRRQGFLDQAKAECLVARSFSPGDDELALLLADIQKALGEHAAAKELYAEVRERDAASTGALLGLASIAMLFERYDEAVELLEAAEQLEPGNALLLNNLAAAHFEIAQRAPTDAEAQPHVERARTLFQAAAALEPRMAEPRAGLAEIYSFVGNHERALIELDKVVLLDNACVYRAMRSQALYENGRAAEAGRAADEVLLECPDELYALGTKALTLIDRHCWRQAYDLYGRVLQIVPGHVKATGNRRMMEEAGLLELGDDQCRPVEGG